VSIACQAPAQRWLARPGVWAAVVLLNARIMTVFLWHATALIAVVTAAWALGGVGLELAPGSAAWWAARPLWLGAALALLAALVALLGRFERPAGEPSPADRAWRSVAGATAAAVGMSAVALGGIAGPRGLRVWAVALLLAGVWLVRGRPGRVAAPAGSAPSPAQRPGGAPDATGGFDLDGPSR
jgi:hypothetical protein